MTTLPQSNPMRLPRPNSSHLAIPSGNGLPVPAQSSAAATLTGADVWRVIRSNLWLIIGMVALAGVGGYFLNMWLANNYAQFTSTALIRVQVPTELPQITDESRTLVSDPSPESIQVEQQTQTASLLAPYFIDSLLEDPQSPIRSTSWFQQYNGRIADAKADLEEKLSVSPKLNTRLIAVAMSCHSPKDAMTIVREVVNRHIADRKQKMQNLQIQRSQDLQSLIDRYNSDLSNIRERISARARELASNFSSGEGSSGLDFELQSLMQQRTIAERNLNEATAKLATFTKEIQQGLTPRELQEAVGRPETSALHAQLNQLQAELAGAKARYGDSNPRVKDLQNQIDSLQSQVDEQEGAGRDKAVAAIHEDLTSAVQVAKDTLKSVTDQMNQVQSARTSVAAKQFELTQLREQERSTRDRLQNAENARDKLELSIQQNNWSTAELAVPADLPEKASFPKLSMTLGLMIVLGLGLSLGIAFLREMMDTSIRSPRDIARVGQLNLLGLIPHEIDDPEVAGARLPLAIYEAPHSMIAEQFRQVRTRLQHSASLDTVRSLLVTGTSPGDGKTTVACNMAAGLALNGRRILLVDANFRRPQVHTTFNLPNELGFADVLNSLDVFDDAVRESEVPNLAIMPSGPKPSNATELLESQLLIDFIERALEEYDHVIFDSGPLLIVSETAALAPRVDGVVTVVRARGNSRGMLQRLRDQLRQLKAEHLGVILNAVRSQTGGYYAPMIKTYYAYQNS